jgi:hypothetical protein
MMDESRLGREQIETQYTLKQITGAGVRVFYYQTGEEARLDTSNGTQESNVKRCQQ